MIVSGRQHSKVDDFLIHDFCSFKFLSRLSNYFVASSIIQNDFTLTSSLQKLYSLPKQNHRLHPKRQSNQRNATRENETQTNLLLRFAFSHYLDKRRRCMQNRVISSLLFKMSAKTSANRYNRYSTNGVLIKIVSLLSPNATSNVKKRWSDQTFYLIGIAFYHEHLHNLISHGLAKPQNGTIFVWSCRLLLRKDHPSRLDPRNQISQRIVTKKVTNY